MKGLITVKDFQNLDFQIGRVSGAGRVEGSDRLLLLQVDLGKASDSDESETKDYRRQIVAGIGRAYDPQALIGRQVVVLANLAPKIIFGVESQGMIIAVDDALPVLLVPEREVKDGAVLR